MDASDSTRLRKSHELWARNYGARNQELAPMGRSYGCVWMERTVACLDVPDRPNRGHLLVTEKESP